MKLAATYHYWRRWCPWLGDDCERAYCQRHRLLYRICETAVRGAEGDSDVPEGVRAVLEVSKDCPRC